MKNKLTVFSLFLLIMIGSVSIIWQTHKESGEKSENKNIITSTSDSFKPHISEPVIIKATPEVTFESTPKPTLKPLAYKKYWVIASLLNVRKEPNKNSKVIDKLIFNSQIKAAKYNNDWFVLSEGGYVSNKFISNKKNKYISYDIPYSDGFKSFMPYNVFSINSNQYRLQQNCYTGKYGIRQCNKRYCVALGSHFNTKIGQYFDLILENGIIVPCIMADQKADCDTDSSNIFTVENGCMTEFVVDFSYSYLNHTAKTMGDISYCTKNWKSRVVK